MAEDKHPKEPFNLVAKEPEVEVVFEADMDVSFEEEEAPFRSNTDPKYDPVNVKNTSLTPSGMGAYFGKPRNQSQDHDPIQTEELKGQASNQDRQEQLRNGNHTVEDEFNGLRVRTWVADEPTEQGIQGGRITEMILTEGDYGSEVELAHFIEGEWQKRPESTPERQAAMEAVREYDNDCLKSKSQQQSQDKHKGHSR